LNPQFQPPFLVNSVAIPLRREPVTELDVERNAALEAELMRKLEVQKEALSKQEKEIWQKEMQVDDVCKIRTRIQICFLILVTRGMINEQSINQPFRFRFSLINVESVCVQ
jgi:hypothetical protein